MTWSYKFLIKKMRIMKKRCYRRRRKKACLPLVLPVFVFPPMGFPSQSLLLLYLVGLVFLHLLHFRPLCPISLYLLHLCLLHLLYRLCLHLLCAIYLLYPPHLLCLLCLFCLFYPSYLFRQSVLSTFFPSTWPSLFLHIPILGQ